MYAGPSFFQRFYMTRVCVIDGNNWFRRKAETDVFGNPLRQCFYELQSMDYDQVILVWDGRGSLSARRKIYPEYKVHRSAPNESLFEFQNEFKQLAQLSKATSIEVVGYEGDDVIASIVNHWKKNGATKIFIESNDADFAQLGCEMARKEFKIPPRWVPLYKAVVGDPSDNIKGIAGFGGGAWDKLDDIQRGYLEAFVKDMDNATDDHYKGLAEFLKPKPLNWLKEEENRKLLKAYYTIVQFIPIEYSSLAASTTPGLNRPDLAEGVLKSYMS